MSLEFKTSQHWRCGFIFGGWVIREKAFISQELRLERRREHVDTCCKIKVFSIAVHSTFLRDWLFVRLGLCACVHHVLALPPQGLMEVCPKAWERERGKGAGAGEHSGRLRYENMKNCSFRVSGGLVRRRAEWRLKLGRRVPILLSLWKPISDMGIVANTTLNIILTLCLRPLPHSAAGNYTKLIMLILCKSLVLLSLPTQGRCTCLLRRPWRSEEGRCWRRRSGRCWARVPRASRNSFTKVTPARVQKHGSFSMECSTKSGQLPLALIVDRLFFQSLGCEAKLPSQMADGFQRVFCRLNKLQVTKGGRHKSALCPVDVWLVTKRNLQLTRRRHLLTKLQTRF